MKRLLLLAAALTATTAISAKDYKIASPDGQIEVKVSTYPELRWSASRAGEPLLNESRIGMTFAGEVPLGAAPTVRSARTKAIDERSTAEVPTKFRELHDRCNELEIAFRGDWALRMRVYDNGVAIPETFKDYLDKWVYSVKDNDELLDKVGGSRLLRLKNEPHLGYSTRH